MRSWIMAATLLAVLMGPRVAQADHKADEVDERGRPQRELWGVATHPYIEFNSDRTSGDHAAWTNGVTAGVELATDPLWLGLGYTLHDILAEREVVPWDGTAFAKLGLYQGGLGNLGSVPTYIHAAVVLAVPTGPDKLALGVEAGFEFDVDPLYAGLRYTVRDTWVDDDDAVYPWNGELGVAVGLYW
jgi:hypothetical protein